MADGTKHNHHTVSKFYLRGFSKNEKITIVKLLDGSHTEQNIKTASVAYDYYSIDPEDFPNTEAKEDDFENWLAEEFERPTGRVFKKIRQGEWPLNPEDRATLAKFITLQMMRVPSHEDSINNALTFTAYATLATNGRENLKEGMKQHLNEDHTEESLDKIWDEIKEGTFRIKSHKNTHLVTIMDELPTMAHPLLGRPWFLVKFSRKTLFTCDNPVIITPCIDGSPTGLINSPEILFPLSRTSAIVMGNPDVMGMEDYEMDDIFDGKYDATSKGNTIFQKQINAHIVKNALQDIYCHPDDFEKLPNDLPQPKQPRNFKNESMQFIQLGEAMRTNINDTGEHTPNTL